jgi:hypothetical protein
LAEMAPLHTKPVTTAAAIANLPHECMPRPRGLI